MLMVCSRSSLLVCGIERPTSEQSRRTMALHGFRVYETMRTPNRLTARSRRPSGGSSRSVAGYAMAGVRDSRARHTGGGRCALIGWDCCSWPRCPRQHTRRFTRRARRDASRASPRRRRLHRQRAATISTECRWSCRPTAECTPTLAGATNSSCETARFRLPTSISP